MKRLTVLLLLTWMTNLIFAQYNYGLEVIDQDAKIEGKLNIDNGNNDVVIGSNAGISLSGGLGGNTFIGMHAGKHNTIGGRNTFIGTAAGRNNTTGLLNTYIGRTSGRANNGSRNAFLGQDCGFYMSVGDENLFLGYGAGLSHSGGNGNILIGNEAGANASGDNKLYIENTNSLDPLIYGEFDNDKIQINGTLIVTEAFQLMPHSPPSGSCINSGEIIFGTDDELYLCKGGNWKQIMTD